MENNITLTLHVKANVLPRLKTEDERETFMDMAETIDAIGVEGYAMTPKELIEASGDSDIPAIEAEMENYDRRTPRWRELNKKLEELKENEPYNQNQWLTFLSHPVVAKFLEKQILKLNTVVYRQKLSQLATKADISQADIKYISILKDIVDEARSSMENDIIHISSFYPPRQHYGSIKEDEMYDGELGVSIRKTIDYLQLDTDYMDYVDVQKAKDKEAAKAKIISDAKAIKKDIKEVDKMVDKNSEVKQEELEEVLGEL